MPAGYSRSTVFDELQQISEEPGHPPALWRIGEYWNSQVAGPVSSLQQKLTPNALDSDHLWSGMAAETYRDAALSQVDALGVVAPMVQKVQDALDDLAWGFVAFWVAIAAAVVTFVVGMTSAVGLAVAVVTAPAAPVDAGGTAAAVVGLVVAAVAALVAYVEKFDNSMTALS